MPGIDELDEFIIFWSYLLENVFRFIKFIHFIIPDILEIRTVVRAVLNLYQDCHMHQLLTMYISTATWTQT